MSSVLRSVRKRKNGRTVGAVDIIDRAEYAELEVRCQGGVDPGVGSAGLDAHRRSGSTRK